MAEIEPGPDNDYQAQSTTPFSRAVWNAVMASIAARLKARELLEATFETLIENGVQAALDMISQNVAPQLSALTTQINDLEDALEELIGGGTAPNALQLGGKNPDYYLALANATGVLPVAQVTGVEALIAAAVAGLVNAAPTTLDTLKEISDALGGDANFAAHMAEALGFRLRVDAAQSLTAEQKAQGLSNLGFAPSDYYTKTEIDPTIAALSNGLSGKISKTGDTMTATLLVAPTTNTNAEFAARYNGRSDNAAFGQRSDGHGYFYVAGKSWFFQTDGTLFTPGGMTVNGQFHAYNPSFEIEGTQAGGVYLWLHRPSVKRGAWHIDASGILHWLDQAGTSHARFTTDSYVEAVGFRTTGGALFGNDGNVYMPWAGQYLSSYLSNLGTSDNARFHGIRWTGGGDVSYSPGAWLGGGSGEVIKGVHSSPSVSGGVDAVRIRYLQTLSNSSGWVTVGDA